MKGSLYTVSSNSQLFGIYLTNLSYPFISRIFLILITSYCHLDVTVTISVQIKIDFSILQTIISIRHF